MDRLYKAAVDIVTQNKHTVQCQVLTDIGQTVEGNSGHSATEQTDGILRGTDRQWTDCKRQQWT